MGIYLKTSGARWVSRIRRPTGIQEVAGSILGSSFEEIWSWKISTPILSVPLIQVRQLSVTFESMGT